MLFLIVVVLELFMVEILFMGIKYYLMVKMMFGIVVRNDTI